MTKFNKIIYILSLIFTGLAAFGGGMTLAGFFFEKSVIQLIGVIMLAIFFVASLILDFVSKRK